jgi:parallel beta-helix repeat protein
MTLGFAGRAALLIAVLTLFFALGAGQASATHVACGDTITQDTTLDSDVNCGASGGLTVGPGVTLDLGGHTVAGGVHASFPGDVVIQNGAIVKPAERETGPTVGASGIVGLVLRDLDLVGATIWIEYGRQLVIEGVTISDTVPDPDFLGFPRAMYIFRSGDFTIANNTIARSAREAILVLEGTGAGAITRNSIRETNGGAIRLRTASNVEISSNRISDAGFGITLASSRNNRIEGNVLRGTETGIFVGTAGAPGALISSQDNLIARNTIRRSAADGIFLEGPKLLFGVRYGASVRTLLERNSVRESGDDGIDVGNPTNTVTGNRVARNRDYGIEAVPGTGDGGGNRAFGNGNPLQCLNVECK